MKELKIWLRYTANSFQQVLAQRSIVFIFVIAKALRILLFLMFLNYLFRGAASLAGYNRDQIIFFYLAFNLIDTAAQLLFREVYRFGSLVVSGGLDQVLVKPLHPLIRVLLGGADVLDFIILLIISCYTFWFGYLHITRHFIAWLGFLALSLNGLLIAAAFHIFVLSLIIIFINVNHLIMIYRDFTSLLRIPVDLYIAPIRWFLTFVIPLALMLTFPPKFLMGLLSWQWVIVSLAFSVISLILSVIFWNYSLTRYQSTGS